MLGNNIRSKFSTIVMTIISCSVIIISTISTFADGKHLFSGSYRSSDASNLKYVLSGGDATYQNMMRAGANAWNGISSKVALSENNTGAKMSIYKSTTTTTGLLGRMYPYYKNFYGGLSEDTSLTNVWEVTDVYGYDNQMTNCNMNIYQKQSNYSHEVGHALSLAHTSDLPSSTYTVMRQGIQQIGPQLTDKDHLKLKWGY